MHAEYESYLLENACPIKSSGSLFLTVRLLTVIKNSIAL